MLSLLLYMLAQEELARTDQVDVFGFFALVVNNLVPDQLDFT